MYSMFKEWRMFKCIGLYIIVPRNTYRNYKNFRLHPFHLLFVCHTIYEGGIINMYFHEMIQ